MSKPMKQCKFYPGITLELKYNETDMEDKIDWKSRQNEQTRNTELTITFFFSQRYNA